MTTTFIPQHFAEVDISDVLTYINKEMPQPEQYIYDVTKDSIRHFAYALEDHNALYLDDSFAKATRWGGIIAPPGYLYAHGAASVWARTLGTIPGFTQNDNAGEQWEFYLPVRPGDRVVSSAKLVDVQKRMGRRAGPLVICFADNVFTNQRGEVVAKVRGSSFRFSRQGVINRGGMAQSYGQARRGPTKGAPPPLRRGRPELRRDARQLYFEDLKEGDDIPTFEPYGGAKLNLNHLGFWDASTSGGRGGGPPAFYGQVQFARRGGIPDAYAGGVMRTAWLGSMLTQWIGPNGWVSKISYQNREWNLVGYKIICKGNVIGKRIDDSRRLVDCDVWVENPMGTVTNPGSATVELPSRA